MKRISQHHLDTGFYVHSVNISGLKLRPFVKSLGRNLFLPALAALFIFAFQIAFGAAFVGNFEARANGKKIGAGPAGQASYVSDARISQTNVVVRKSRVVEFGRPYATALIGDSEVADVVPLSDHSIYVLGKQVGASRLTVVDEHQRIIKIIEVDVIPDVPDLRAKLAENIPEADIHVSPVSGGLVISGTVLSAPDIERAIAIATRYVPSENITNALKVASPQQVMLEVRFVEAARSAGREIGVSTTTRSNSTIAGSGRQPIVTDNGALQIVGLLSGAEPFGTILTRVLAGGTDADLMIRALEEKSLARRLAEPNLVTTSGDTASFLAGGEFPFPVSASDNRIAIEFKQFGIALAFTPTVLSGGLINLKIAPEVSDIDETVSVEVNNVRIPGLVVRRANTTVELRDGQSLAIAGLLQNTHRKGRQQLPWIGSVPVLGSLFASSEYQKAETDLVIIVTPRLIKPKRPGEVLKTPLDDKVASNDVDFFLNGRMELSRNQQNRRDPRLYGHIIDTGIERAAYAVTK